MSNEISVRAKQMSNYKWCLPLTNRANGVEIELGCAKWVCTCGHIPMDHMYGSNYPCNAVDPMNEGFCYCRRFKFANNDNCSIECLVSFKIEEAKCIGVFQPLQKQ